MLCKPHPLVGRQVLQSMDSGGLNQDLGGKVTVMVNHCVVVGCK